MDWTTKTYPATVEETFDDGDGGSGYVSATRRGCPWGVKLEGVGVLGELSASGYAATVEEGKADALRALAALRTARDAYVAKWRKGFALGIVDGAEVGP